MPDAFFSDTTSRLIIPSLIETESLTHSLEMLLINNDTLELVVVGLTSVSVDSDGSTSVFVQTGPEGPAGPQGAQGPAGEEGPAGEGGPAGPAGTGVIGYFYNLEPSVIAIEGDVSFSNNSVLAGFTHNAGQSEITITASGMYEIAFSVTAVESNQFAIFVNGALLPGSVYGSGAGTQQNNGQAIATLAAGDIISLRNHTSAAAVTLQTLAGGTNTNTNASIMIKKVN